MSQHTHVLREANCVADRLAKMDSRGINGSGVFYSPPDDVRSLLQANRDRDEDSDMGWGLGSQQGVSAMV
ncbi:hypothetical protein V6N12_068914 [Hibiscus sabdariffa]|uniref:RNase H type-1 domain-containing protein n=1 Tax=Hibiscus sabdariffa TaxID=183260 RepID=A0ABR2CA63_9ROSI